MFFFPRHHGIWIWDHVRKLNANVQFVHVLALYHTGGNLELLSILACFPSHCLVLNVQNGGMIYKDR